ncbi:uncharacterized mitochondrial protein AtMg00810-like [Solanum tuberosum]|uniref:uncharacterized mitochondrial protein AtMg00810-like n=1 Tax=Solanum tuberosum TaxID=4113 RepID=UPI00073A2265|nr:PREDICTED: uncharacterized mitochondrial protein AtMg00810-like [Solanum tuberosum]
MAIVRSVISIAAARHWHIHQMDVYNAFLQEDLYEEVYMTLPEGFSGEFGNSQACKLSDAGILIHQRKYALELISDMGLAGGKPVSTPMKLNQKLTTVEFDDNIPPTHPDEMLKDPASYQRLIGRLLYLTTTRSNISFAVQCLSQFMHSPKASHMKATLRLVRYLKSAPGLGILMSFVGGTELKVFCDADWGACINSRRSVTWYLIQYGGSLISWKSKK